MINSALELFEKLATQASHRFPLDEVLKMQTIEIQQAFYQNDNNAMKSLFCHHPQELADKTTVFQI